jgi:hypothetical protein
MLLDGVTPCQSVRSTLKEGHICVRVNGLGELLRKSSAWMSGGSESKAWDAREVDLEEFLDKETSA